MKNYTVEPFDKFVLKIHTDRNTFNQLVNRLHILEAQSKNGLNLDIGYSDMLVSIGNNSEEARNEVINLLNHLHIPFEKSIDESKNTTLREVIKNQLKKMWMGWEEGKESDSTNPEYNDGADQGYADKLLKKPRKNRDGKSNKWVRGYIDGWKQASDDDKGEFREETQPNKLCKFCKTEKAISDGEGWYTKETPICQKCFDKLNKRGNAVLDKMGVSKIKKETTDEGFGWGSRKDSVKDPKHIKGEFWRIKYQSTKDLKKHGDKLGGQKIEENMKHNKLKNIIQECISEVINEYKEEDEIKLIGRIRDIAFKAKDLIEPHLQQGALATIYGLTNQLVAMHKKDSHTGNIKDEPEDAFGQRGYMGYTPPRKKSV